MNILPSDFLLARDSGHGFSADNHDYDVHTSLPSADGILAEIESEFGISAPESDLFKQLENHFASSFLRDPFDIAVSSSFGSSDSDYFFDQDPHDEALFDIFHVSKK